MDLDVNDLKRLSDNQLKFLGKHKLNDDQLAVALAVDNEARRQGVNPDFVWPMVYQESKFDANAKSPKGAFGVMQLMEDTANGLKVDRNDPEQNIRGGISLIKELVTNPIIGNDPYKVLAGYNASMDTRNKFYQSGDLKDLPDETLAHMHSVAKNFGGELPDVNFSSEPQQSNQGDSKTTDKSGTVVGGSAPEPIKLPVGLAAGVGANFGATAGLGASALEAKKDALEKGAELYKNITQKSPSVDLNPIERPSIVSSPSSTSDGLIPSQAQHDRAFQGTKKEGNITGRASQTTYNLRTQEIANEAKKKAEILERLRKAGVLTGQGIDLSKYGHAASTPSGVVVSAPAAEEFAAKTAAATAKPASKFSPLLEYATRLGSYPVKGALAGASLAGGAADIYNRMADKNYGEAALSALGSAAGTVAPFVGAAASLPLSAVGAAIPLYLTATDNLKHLAKHPEQIRLQDDEYDAMGNRQR